MAAPFPQETREDGDANAEGRPQREVAQRVFAAEYNASTLEFKEGGERSPSYVVTPLGARVNRLFLVGVLTANEKVGASGEVWKAQILDPTGTFSVYAGQYQPEAASALAELKPPAVVAVVGKSRTYSPEPGVTYTSVRPESIRVVEVADRDRWIAETAEHTIRRLEAVQEALKLDPASAEAIEKLGYAKDLADGVSRALATYGPPDAQRYASMIRDALESLVPGAPVRDSPPAAIPKAPSAVPDFTPASAGPRASPGIGVAAPKAPVQPAKPAAPAADAAAEKREELVADLCQKLDEGKGAPWEEIVAEAARHKITEEQVEECLNSLMDKGIVYEPVLGRLKRT